MRRASAAGLVIESAIALAVAALVAWTSHTRERSVTTERSVTR